MFRLYIIFFLISLIAGIFATWLIIPLLKRLKIGQTVLKYVTEHYLKNGTPTMGGIAFVLVTVAVYFIGGIILGGFNRIATVSLLIFIFYAAVGFTDDFIKIKFAKNDGLTPIQKIIFQSLVGITAVGFCLYAGLTKVYIPFTDKLSEFGIWFVPIGLFVFLATTNCVNLTDGLDGLAGSVSVATLLSAAVMICVQTEKFGSYYIKKEEYLSLSLLAVTAAGAVSGFLAFNTNKASLFMGDTGSLALGGLIACVYMFSGNTFYIPFIGITFVLSGVSVILQVVHYKRTKTRIFLMAPLHHHFQHKGHAESKIVFWYTMITFIIGLISICFIL